jgi:hypothetical protein
MNSLKVKSVETTWFRCVVLKICWKSPPSLYEPSKPPCLGYKKNNSKSYFIFISNTLFIAAIGACMMLLE